MMAKLGRALVAGCLALVVVGTVPAAAADTRVVARGHCSAESLWRLGLATDGEKIAVGFRVDASNVGEVWRVHIRHQRIVVFRGRRVAMPPDGIFGVRLAVRNLEGPDVMRAFAYNIATGEVCRGRAVI